MKSRSRRPKLPQVVVSLSGDVFLDASAVYSAEQCAKLVRSGTVFIGVKLTPKEVVSFHRDLDNALAEIVARIGGARLRANRE